MQDIFTIQDRRMREFGPLVLAQNEDTVRRGIADELRRDTMVSRYPGDFDLYFLGVYDPRTGLMSLEQAPRMVCTVEEIRLQFNGNGGDHAGR